MKNRARRKLAAPILVVQSDAAHSLATKDLLRPLEHPVLQAASLGITPGEFRTRYGRLDWR